MAGRWLLRRCREFRGYKARFEGGPDHGKVTQQASDYRAPVGEYGYGRPWVALTTRHRAPERAMPDGNIYGTEYTYRLSHKDGDCFVYVYDPEYRRPYTETNRG